MVNPKGSGFKKKDVNRFNWGLYPKAENFLNNQINAILRYLPHAKKLATLMDKKTSTNIIDWVDHIVLPSSFENQVKQAGFTKIKEDGPGGTSVYRINTSMLCSVVINNQQDSELVIKPEVLSHFTRKYAHGTKISGVMYSRYRKALLYRKRNYVLSGVERRGYKGYCLDENPKDIQKYKQALAHFRKRKRRFPSDKKGMEYTLKLVQAWAKKLSTPRVADAFFRAEREYWLKRNKAGQIQKKRQDQLGLGWGNHDHHTFRSSRGNFPLLIAIMETLGFECRERFYAGEKAGWGAQILEHKECDIVLFCDADMTPTDRHIDFAHKGFGKEDHFQTVGLWVALHGESILQASMHHLEARFNFAKLTRDLKKKSVSMMRPFSNFPFLKQAFTEGETWKVQKKRLDQLLKSREITKDQYHEFARYGAIGSHMENLQRKQGFKGFNQRSVSVIIAQTDPRKQEHHHGA